MAISFSSDQILDRIKFENPWWKTSEIDGYYSKMKKRKYFDLLFPLIIQKDVKRSIVLMGPRRVGKTVMLYHSIDALIKKGIPPKNICYFSIETPLYNGIGLEEFLTLFLSIHRHKLTSELYIFFDEIQYLKNWELHLKSLVDSYHNFKFVVSGSAAAALKLKSQESGAGRFSEFVLPPLTFHEFLSLTNSENLIDDVSEKDPFYAIMEYKETDIKELNDKFIEYINYGGYPELSLSRTMQSDPGRYIRNDIIDKVLLRDLPSLYGIQDIQELNSLFTYLAYNSGNELSLDEISQNSGVAKNTIKKYITYLEAAYLIKVIHRIDQNCKIFKRANFFKVYLTNPSLRSALFSPLSASDDFIGNMVETAIFAQWQHGLHEPMYYARWNTGEVDLVYLQTKQKPLWCVEIKWSNRYAKNISLLKNLKSFCIKHQLERVMITTKDIWKVENEKSLAYEFTPASVYCYTVGRNLIDGKKLFESIP